MNIFIHWMYYNNLLLKDGIIYDTTDVCRKQYICANSMWLLSVLAFIYRLIMDRFINAQVRGRNKIDCITRSDKTYLKQKCL